MRIELTIPIDDFNQETYIFWLSDNNILFLDSYNWWHRDTIRKKWKVQKHYNRLSDRNSTMTEEQVLLNDEIKKMAIDKIISTIAIKKWSER